jgi:hypothetical protein
MLAARPRLHMPRRISAPAAGIALTALALIFAATMSIVARVRPADPCSHVPQAGLFLNSSSGGSTDFTSQQKHAMSCLMMPALAPTRGGVPGLKGAPPHLSVTAGGMMYNITWAGHHGRTASLMIDHHLGSRLDVAHSNPTVDLGNGVVGYWTNWSDGRGTSQTHELGWRDPRTGMWYKINGLSLRDAIALYHTLTPVKQVTRQ